MTEEKKPAEPAKAAATTPATPPKAPAATAGATEKAPDTAASTTAPTKEAEKPAPSAATGEDASKAAEAAKKAAQDEFEKALLEEDTTEVPSEDELDAFDPINNAGLDATQTAAVTRVLEKLANLSLDVVQAGSPDSYNLFGYSGINISLGEIRVLSRAYRKGQQ